MAKSSHSKFIEDESDAAFINEDETRWRFFLLELNVQSNFVVGKSIQNTFRYSMFFFFFFLEMQQKPRLMPCGQLVICW